jgi:hypothetical protein
MSLVYHIATRQLRFHLSRMVLAGGTATIEGSYEAAGWRLSGEVRGVSLERLPQALVKTLSVPADTRFSGTAALKFVLTGRGSELQQVRLDINLSRLDFSEPGGQREAQALQGRIRLQGRREGARWGIESSAALNQGLLYLDPVLLDTSRAPTLVQLEASWEADRHRLEVSRLVIESPGLWHGEGKLVVHLDRGLTLRMASLRLSRSPLGPLYQTFLQPWLLGSVLDNLDTHGNVAAEIHYERGKRYRLRALLDKVSVDDRSRRFGIAELSGVATWDSDVTAESSLRWQNGHFYRVPFGAGEFKWTGKGRQLRLVDKLSLPVLDGTLLVHALDIQNAGGPGATWQLQGVLTPASLEDFADLMGWPSMGGTLSAVVPEVSYAREVLSVGGAVLVRVFDGEIVLHQLRLERPLGVAPVLSAEIEAKRLDFYALTQAFAFGTVTGRVSGYVRGLRLESWQPVAFDAFLYTSPKDTLAHRISQQAVETLTSLGGGGLRDAISRAFLQFFEEFSYKRLGLRCRLKNGVCEMDGVAPAPNGGYYIVEGGFGLPSIDVIGFNRQVDWEELVKRLAHATRTTPTVK